MARLVGSSPPSMATGNRDLMVLGRGEWRLWSLTLLGSSVNGKGCAVFSTGSSPGDDDG